MSIEFTFDEELNCLLTLCTDRLDVQEYRTYLGTLEADRRIQPDHACLCDIRYLDEPPSTATVKQLAKARRESFRRNAPRQAALIAEPGAQYGVIRMFTGWLCSDREVAFTDINKAIDWLGLPPTPRDPFSWDIWRADCVCNGESCSYSGLAGQGPIHPGVGRNL